MIDKQLTQTTYADIDQLVREKRPEGKTIDYKRDPYGNRDEDKKELLKDVSSFANTQGGDILIGVDEDKGVPTGIPGVAVPDIDKEKLRLEEIIRRGLDPRIDFAIHHVLTPASTCVIIIRIPESNLFPHRVVFQGKLGEFWARGSGGKYSMDTDELRTAFTLSATIYEQIKAFRSERIAQVSRGETPVPMALTRAVTPDLMTLEGRMQAGDNLEPVLTGTLVLHLVPVSSFRSRQQFDVATMPELAVQFAALNESGVTSRLNLEGHVSFTFGMGGSTSYTQFFRNGSVEFVLSGIVIEDKRYGKRLDAENYEAMIVQHFPRVMSGFRQVGIQPPVWGFLTLLGVKDAYIPTRGFFPERRHIMDRDILVLPEFVVGDLGTDAASLLRLPFNMVWNAVGVPHSLNYDASGHWQR
jgi:hypothetical protein